jgi:hypothetical protein
MAYVHFDHQYAPCGFLIVKDGGNPRDDSDSILIQTDWDWPGVASRMGFVPCECGATDGTVKCAHKTASDMIAAAYDHIEAHEGESFPCLDEYFPEQE